MSVEISGAACVSLEWPALAGLRSAELRFERAVWGKAHGAGSDFRWLAASGGFEAASSALGRRLNLGLEDRPARAVCWHAGGGAWSAVGLYPSRAADAAGRRGFLEKQVLRWRPEAGPPPAAGAFALLAAAAALDDSAWWPRRGEVDWARAGSALEIAAADHRPLAVSEPWLAEQVTAGLSELRASAPGEEALAGLYAGLLAGARPARLEAVAAPLPPRALAALLLPLPRQLADGLSLAGWLPSSRGDLEEIGRRWQVVAVPAGFRAGAPAGEATGDRLEEGRRLARALWEGDPSPLERPAGAESLEVTEPLEVAVPLEVTVPLEVSVPVEEPPTGAPAPDPEVAPRRRWWWPGGWLRWWRRRWRRSDPGEPGP